MTQKTKVALEIEIKMQIYTLCSCHEDQIKFRSNESFFQQSFFFFHEEKDTKHTQAYINSKLSEIFY